MLPYLVLGVASGVMFSALWQHRPGHADGQHTGAEQQSNDEQQAGPQLPVPLPDNPCQDAASRRRVSNAKIAAAAVGGLACVAAIVSLVLGKRRRNGKQHGSRRTDGRIPLKDLIRFKERQWFVEELELARDADPMSMIRLAKMYLNGQGCQRNIALAQEWVRKARAMGVPATLDELYATDDPDPHTKLRTLAAAEERRRALRQLNSAAKAGHKHMPQANPHRHTAAA